jgi:hypothetical protein
MLPKNFLSGAESKQLAYSINNTKRQYQIPHKKLMKDTQVK